jgi:hypothetical protein
MGIFSFFKKGDKPIVKLEKSQKKVSKLIAQLEEPPKDISPDNCFGYYNVDRIVTELESIGDPIALSSLVAKQKEIDNHLSLMGSGFMSTKMKKNFQFLSKLKEKIGRVIRVLERKTNEKAVENTQVQQARSFHSSPADGREVTFVIPCGVCGCKTEVTVTIDWDGGILSGTSTDHEFNCLNCKKVFTVSKDSLKQYTDRFV